MKTFFAFLLAFSSSVAFGSGSIICQGSDYIVSWATSHTLGDVPVSNITTEVSGVQKSFCANKDSTDCEQVIRAGYWVDHEKIMLHLVNESASASLLELKAEAISEMEYVGNITKYQGEDVDYLVNCFKI